MANTDFQNGFVIGLASKGIVGEGGGPAVQADWEATTPETGAIKNKPFGFTTTTETIDEFTVDVSAVIGFASKKGFVIGETYTIDVYTDETNYITITPTVVDTYDLIGMHLPGFQEIISDNGTMVIMIDGLSQDLSDPGDYLAVMACTLEQEPYYSSVLFETYTRTSEDKYLVSKYKPIIQSDYNVSDKDDPEYINNRPFYEDTYTAKEIWIDCNSGEKANDRYNLYYYLNNGESYGLTLGDTYNVIATYDSNGVENTESFEAQCTDQSILGLELPTGSLGLVATSGTFTSAYTLIENCAVNSSGNLEYDSGSMLYFKGNDSIDIQFKEIEVTGDTLPEKNITKIRKINNKFIDVDFNYNENSVNPQSGISVGEALKKYGINYITDNTDASTLESGVYSVSPFINLTNITLFSNSSIKNIRTQDGGALLIIDHNKTTIYGLILDSDHSGVYYDWCYGFNTDMSPGIEGVKFQDVANMTYNSASFVNERFKYHNDKYPNYLGIYLNNTKMTYKLLEPKGINLLDPDQIAEGYKIINNPNEFPEYEYTTDHYCITGIIDLVNQQDYTISYSGTWNTNFTIKVVYLTPTGACRYQTSSGQGNKNTPVTFNALDVGPARIEIYHDNMNISDFQIEQGSTASAHEAYQAGIRSSLLPSVSGASVGITRSAPLNLNETLSTDASITK